MRHWLMTLCIASLLLVAGCTTDTVRTEIILDPNEIGMHVDGTDALSVHSFDYGTHTVQLESGESFSFPMRGSYSVPEEKKLYPIVFMGHGRSDLYEHAEDLYEGYDYVIGHLAANDVIGLSLDFHAAFPLDKTYEDEGERVRKMMQATIETVIARSREANNPFSKKVHPDKIGVVGFTETGQYVFELAEHMQSNKIKVDALLAVNPQFIEKEINWPEEVDRAIIVSEYDNIVKTYDGYAMYDELSSKSALKLITLLKKGNHHYFNTKLTTNDVAEYGTNFELRHQLKREEQEQFFKQYVTDYFLGILNRTETSLIRSLQTRAQPDRMYGQDVLLTAELKGTRLLLDPAKVDLENVHYEKTEAELVKDTLVYQEGSIPLLTGLHPNGTIQERSFLKVDWLKKSSSIDFEPLLRNIVGDEVLTVNFILGPASERNKSYLHQAFAVELEDEAGNVGRARLPEELNAIEIEEGGLHENDAGELRWSRYTPIRSVRIPLERFVDIDFEHVTKLSLYFGDTDEGTILIHSITVQ